MWNRQGEMEKGCVHPSRRADTQQALTRKGTISWKETWLIFYLLTATFTVGPGLGCQEGGNTSFNKEQSLCSRLTWNRTQGWKGELNNCEISRGIRRE